MTTIINQGQGDGTVGQNNQDFRRFNTIIEVPVAPEEIGVVLPPDALRRIDFSALDFEALRRSVIEYVRAYYPNDFNDFILSNGFLMYMEVASSIGNVMSERSDIMADEAFLPTAQSRASVSQHLELIGQRLLRATPAVVEVECSLAIAPTFDVQIPAGLIFTIPGPDGSPVNYELYRAPDDYNSNIVIPRGKRGVIAFGVEGSFASPVREFSNGEENQFIDILAEDVLNDPITVDVLNDGQETRWSRIEYIETADANDEVFEARFLDDRTRIIFGDNVTGMAPIEGQEIVINYRKGGGVRGRIGSGAIDESRPIGQQGFATQNVIFRNVAPSRGGHDDESLEAAKRRAPRQFAIHGNVATAQDYINFAETFTHSVYGSVQKASAIVKSGVEPSVEEVVQNVRAAPTEQAAAVYLLGNYVNRNIVEMYILQESTGDTPVAPNKGLKIALETALADINVFTDDVVALDGLIRIINVDMVITVSRNVDAALIKERVEAAVQFVFDINTHEMGQEFIRSTLITTVQAVDGVKALNLYEPADDFPALRFPIAPGTPQEQRPHAIGANELWVLGAQKIQFFYEQGNLNV